MSEERKVGINVRLNNETAPGFEEIKRDARDVAQVVGRAGQDAAKGISAIGDGAEQAAQKLNRSEGQMISALKRATEQAKLAADAGGTLARAFEQKIEMRGMDASKLGPFVQELREAETALARFKAQQSEASGRSAFLESLRAQADALGKTRVELLELKAAQLGIGTDAAPFIARLREAEKGVQGIGTSAAATAAAMRGVPAQLSDIFVSLQGGMPVMTVFMQQGLQLRDMFGGFGAAGKALGATLLSMVNPFTVAGAAALALGAAYYQGSKEVDALRLALVTTGRASDVSLTQLRQFATEMGAISGAEATASAALADFIGAGVRGGAALKEFGQAAIDWEKTTGTAVEKTAQAFARLQDDPLKAALELQKGMNFLTVATFEEIRALEEQGRKSEAAAVAQRAYAAALRSGAGEIRENLGLLERAWNGLGKTASAAWDFMLGVGRSATLADKMGGLRGDISAIERQLAAGTGFSEAAYQRGVKDGRGEVSAAWREADLARADAAMAEAQANAKETQRRLDQQQENQRAQDLELARARNDAARDAADAAGLREQNADLARRWSAAVGDSPSGSECAAAGDAIGVLADVLGRADRRAGVLAAYADAARAAGLKCERDYDTLSRPSQPDTLNVLPVAGNVPAH